VLETIEISRNLFALDELHMNESTRIAGSVTCEVCWGSKHHLFG